MFALVETLPLFQHFSKPKLLHVMRVNIRARHTSFRKLLFGVIK